MLEARSRLCLLVNGEGFITKYLKYLLAFLQHYWNTLANFDSYNILFQVFSHIIVDEIIEPTPYSSGPMPIYTVPNFDIMIIEHVLLAVGDSTGY